MSPEKAVEIATDKGAFREEFFGTVILRIHAGAVKEIEMSQTFREAAPTAA